MKVVKCQNGHFYDGDTYESCPVCGATSASAGAKTSSKSSPFGKKTVAPTPAPTASAFTGEDSYTGSAKTQALTDMENSAPSVVPVSQPQPQPVAVGQQESKTLDFWQTAPQVEPQPVAQPVDNPEPAPSAPPVNDGPSLKESIAQAGNNEGKTVGFFSVGNTNAGGGTATDNSASQPITDPVVGWLVAINGPHLGQSFALSAGRNTIGRGAGNKVVLARDNQVSREKHAFIIYEPKHRLFFLQPGEGSGLTYLNEEYISESKPLKMNDKIELGGTLLMFVPLCNENFSWEEYIH